MRSVSSHFGENLPAKPLGGITRNYGIFVCQCALRQEKSGNRMTACGGAVHKVEVLRSMSIEGQNEAFEEVSTLHCVERNTPVPQPDVESQILAFTHRHIVILGQMVNEP